jgi:hypothetical protein
VPDDLTKEGGQSGVMTEFDYEYCRDAQGAIGRRLLLAHVPLVVAGELYSTKIGVWLLSPEVSADMSRECYEPIRREVAAEALGEAALRRGGEATSLADVDEPTVATSRTTWLIERIIETQAHARSEGDSVGRALEGVEAHSREWWSGMHRWHELCFAFGTLYSLWDELRLIQAHELVRKLEQGRGASVPERA